MDILISIIGGGLGAGTVLFVRWILGLLADSRKLRISVLRSELWHTEQATIDELSQFPCPHDSPKECTCMTPEEIQEHLARGGLIDFNSPEAREEVPLPPNYNELS